MLETKTKNYDFPKKDNVNNYIETKKNESSRIPFPYIHENCQEAS